MIRSLRIKIKLLKVNENQINEKFKHNLKSIILHFKIKKLK